MLTLELALVAGRPPRWNQHMRRWEAADVWKVVLADRKTILVIPSFAIRGELHAGDTDVILELRDCGFTRDLSEWLWRMEMGQ